MHVKKTDYFGDYMKNLYEPGELIETKIVAISDDTIFLDLGLKTEGLLEKSELADENGNLSVKEGDLIKVYFVGSQNDEFYFTTKISGQKADLSLLENAYKNEIPVEGRVSKEIKGGFEVMLGNVRAFCPYSQMGFREHKESSEYLGKNLTFKISEFKNEGKNIVVSNRAILEVQANENLNKLAQKYQVGAIVKGKVESLESYGAFIDLDGFKALLPISEISHVRVNSVADVLKIGQEITAKIIKTDWEHERVSLSTRELEADPWEAVKTSLKVGDVFENAKISRVADFGVFINLLPGVDGLVHISKLNVERNTNLKKVYKVGDELSVSIEKIDFDEKRISLTPVVSNEEEENAKEYLSSHNEDDGETYNPFAALLKRNK